MMTEGLLLSPPVVFIIILGVVLSLSFVLSKLAYKPERMVDGLTKSYACGEDLADNMVQPDYSQFFPFAFYFTILHVVALMVAAVPTATIETLLIAVIYIIGAIIGLLVLYRR
jgi:NADH:ubiquinone oxidoreductase subunit 3 (subunit A)